MPASIMVRRGEWLWRRIRPNITGRRNFARGQLWARGRRETFTNDQGKVRRKRSVQQCRPRVLYSSETQGNASIFLDYENAPLCSAHLANSQIGAVFGRKLRTASCPRDNSATANRGDILSSPHPITRWRVGSYESSLCYTEASLCALRAQRLREGTVDDLRCSARPFRCAA